MTRFVIGPDVALRLAEQRSLISEEHQLVAPTLLRSQVLSALFAAAGRGEVTEKEAGLRLQADAFATLDGKLAKAVAGLVRVASIEELVEDTR